MKPDNGGAPRAAMIADAARGAVILAKHGAPPWIWIRARSGDAPGAIEARTADQAPGGSGWSLLVPRPVPRHVPFDRYGAWMAELAESFPL